MKKPAFITLAFFVFVSAFGQTYSLDYTYQETEFDVGRLTNFEIHENYLYAVTWSTTGADYIMIYDISNGQITGSAAQIDISDLGASSSSALEYHQGYLYLVTSGEWGLHVFDVRNLSNPQFVGTTESFVLEGSDKRVGTPAYLNFFGNKLFMSYNIYSTAILDVTNPASIAVLYGLKDSGINTLADFIPTSSNRAFLATESSLRSVDYTNPSSVRFPNSGESGYFVVPGDEVQKMIFVENQYLIGLSEDNITDSELFVFDIQTNQVVGSISLDLNVTSSQIMVYDEDAKKIIINGVNFTVIDASSFSNMSIVSGELEEADLAIAYRNGILYTHGDNNEILHYSNGSGGSNNPPTILNSLTDQTLSSGFGSISIDLSNTFTDPDGDPLTYSATSSNQSVATVSVSGSSLQVSEVGVGTTSITVTANDGNGGSASDVFEVVVASDVDALEARIAASATTVEVGNAISFSDISLGNPTNRSWSFSAGSPSGSTATNPTIHYYRTGTHDVSLTVSDGINTDEIILEDFVTVTPPLACNTATNASLGINTTPSAPSWFTYTPDFDGIINISSAGSTGDTYLVVYSDCDGETVLALNDDIDFAGGIYLSEVDVSVFQNEPIYIFWDDRWSSNGFSWTISIAPGQFPSESDSLALVKLYESTNGDSWINNENWLTGPVRSWHGVRLEEGRVTFIDLGDDGEGNSGNNLTGELPDELNDLTGLKWFDFSDNLITGSIPDLRALTNVSYLSLTRNEFSGSLGGWIKDLTNLDVLALGGNNLTGTIPAELGDLPNLTELYLWGNKIAGEIPPNLVNASSLRILWLSNNLLEGNMPTEFGDLANLEEVYLYGNNISGSLPESIYQLSELRQLNLYYNELSGTISPSIGNLKNLVGLDLGVNNFTGSIPSEIGQLNKLVELSFFDNGFTGEIPTSIWNLTNLESLSFSANNLSGQLSASIGNLTKLKSLTLRTNNFEGELTQSLGQLTDLEVLSVRQNNFTGSVPEGLADLPIQVLRIEENDFDELPDFSAVSTLTEFQARTNQFTFEDLEPNVQVLTDTTVQKPFGEATSLENDEGEEVTLQVQIPGIGANDSYQWYKDGSPVDGATNETLTITEATLDDVGEYYLAISNSLFPLFTIDSESITLNINEVNEMPTIVSPLDNLTLTEGFDQVFVELGDVFDDTDGDQLQYTAVSADENVIQIAVTNDILTLEEQGIGAAIITVSASDGNGGEVDDSFIVTVEEALSVGGTDKIRIYPNPSSNLLHFKGAQLVEVTISSLDGKELLRIKNVKNQQIDISELPAGTYLIRLQTISGEMIETKIIKE